MKCHLTIDDEPVCVRLDYPAGNVLLTALDVLACGYLTLAEARAAQKRLQTKFTDVDVVRGACPLGPQLRVSKGTSR